MKRELLNKKRKLLTRLTRDEYNAYLQFIEKVYLSEYDLKILMARKFSNLFIALLELTREENGGRVRHLYEEKYLSCEKEPIIVSNRALFFLRQRIMDGKIKRILLADDIIIHGRTLNDVYELLLSWFIAADIHDYAIDVFAYAESKTGLLDVPVLKNRYVETVCTETEWRNISNQIVDIFYLMGQPYTSYVPNYRAQANSTEGKKIEKFLTENKKLLTRITNPDMEMRHVQSYMYLQKDKPDFSIACTARIYHYQDIEEFLVVPMVTFEPMQHEQLEHFMEPLREWMSNDFNERCNQLLEEECEECYRCMIYGVSALWGWLFVEKQLDIKAEDVTYDKREEQYNFSQEFWTKKCSLYDVMNTWNTLINKTKTYSKEELNKVFIDDLDVKELSNILEGVIKINVDRNKNNAKDWISSNAEKEVIQAIIGKFLAENGRIDEEKCKKMEIKRNIGLPLYSFISAINNQFKNKSNIVASILYAIDFGKGSIIAKKYRNYYMTFIHAGEQNYKYYENHYFPFLYGLYRLEIDSQRDIYNKKQLEDNKKEFINKYLQYWEKNGLYYTKADIDYISGISVEEKYSKVLLYDLLDYIQNPHLCYVVDIV